MGELKQFNPGELKIAFVINEAWDLLETGDVDAVYTGNGEAAVFLAAGSNAESYTKMHFGSTGSEGVSYMCRAEFGDIVQMLNQGLRLFKQRAEYKELCDRYPTIDCDMSGTVWANAKTGSHPKVADHPTTRADIVIGTEADWGVHNNIENGELVGFDIELTKAVCKEAGKTCAIVTVPWQSVWPARFPELGWPDNTKTYPGIGTNNAWYHCTCGTRNTIARQQSAAFTDPYTDKTKDYSGFVVKKGSSMAANAAGKKVAILESQAYTVYFRENMGELKQFNPSELVVQDLMYEVWTLLETGDVDAVYTGTGEATVFLAAGSNAESYTKMHFGSTGSEGVSYMCRAEFGDVVQMLNQGLRLFKQRAEYKELCDRYPTIDCDMSGIKPTVMLGALLYSIPSEVLVLSLAVRIVNAHSALLPGFILRYTYTDGGCSAADSLQALGKLQAESNLHALLGPGCSTGCEPTGV